MSPKYPLKRKRKGEAIVDSRKITANRYYETSQVGEMMLELLI